MAREVLLLFFIGFIGLSSSAICQTNDIDSLEMKLAQHPEPDTLRASLLCKLGWKLVNQEPSRGMRLAEEAISIARRHHTEVTVACGLRLKGFLTGMTGNASVGLNILADAKAISMRNKDSLGVIDAVNNMAIMYSILGDHDTALCLMKNVEKYRLRNGDRERLASVYMNMGVMHQFLGNTASAIRYRAKELSIHQENGDSARIGVALLAIGDLQRDPQKALEYYRRAEPLLQRSGNLRAQAVLAVNRGVAFKDLQRGLDAMKSLEFGLAGAERLNDPFLVGIAANNLSTLYQQYCQHERAIPYLARALQLSRTHRNAGLEATCLVNLGWHQYYLGRHDSALSAVAKALEIESQANNLKIRKCAHEVLFKTHAEQGDYEAAFHSLMAHKTISDSLNSQASQNLIEELNARYEAQKKQSTIDLLRKDRALNASLLQQQLLQTERQRQRIELLARNAEIQQLEVDMTAANLRRREADAAQNQQRIELLEKDRRLRIVSLEQETMRRNAAVVGALILLLLSALLYRHLRQRRRMSELRAEVAESKAHAAEVEAIRVQAEADRRQKDIQRQFSHRLLDSQEQERKRIAAELHDSIGQELIVIKNSLLMVKDETGSEQDLDLAIRSVGETLENVRRVSRDLRPLQLDYYGIEKSLAALIRRINDSTSLQISLKSGKLDGALDKEGEVNVYRIVQEGLNNILRHAEAQHAAVTLLPENGSLYLRIEDDGQGLPADPLERERLIQNGFGLKGMSERVHILGGDMQIDSAHGSGTCIDIRIPMQRVRAEGIEADIHETA